MRCTTLLTQNVRRVYITPIMRLSNYMAEFGLSDEEVAAAIGKNRVSVSRYRRGVERPSSTTIGDIFTWSNGCVAPNDWFDPVTNDDGAPLEETDQRSQAAE